MMANQPKDLSDIEEALRWFLAEAASRKEGKSTLKPPTSDDLFDLAEGRLSATEREELIERIAGRPDSEATLADILTGIELSESHPIEGVHRNPLADWIKAMLTPKILVPAFSLGLLLLVALPLLMEGPIRPPDQPGATVRDFPFQFLETPTPASGAIPSPTTEVTVIPTASVSPDKALPDGKGSKE